MTKVLVWNEGFAQRECAVEYPSDSDLNLKFPENAGRNSRNLSELKGHESGSRIQNSDS
jgi:hypothetical protein